ncbi:SpoIIE family protein phosphatase [Streptomyces sp. ALI-76-A]|jgi:serine phosphatase RsbU (regulator of sigma subunit)/anti-sigma regulatory factor (Ser/Thr protein kinase)|uniref:SpoIIE family protein phosphatase n=1 Tax=Streptomyces sp. ALI-76-A TaxID=3025736 RepID=UPI00256F063F|nr:SpoIIE family protein phosphatase [Streptomyces sp. ALI-76-A]MDL5205737.1 SpoIIE family protein phosphatase [Streptomyces sp. ALI-76-A]
MGFVGDSIGPSRARERFLEGGPVEGGVRDLILSSWQRSVLLGLSPDQSELPFREDVDLDSRLVHAAGPVLDWLQSRFAGRRMNVALADASGTVLRRRFGEASMARQLAPIQSVPGFVFAEEVAGTNGIGIALAERRLCQVYGAEHFAERSQANACSAIPVRDLLSGDVEGILSLGCPHTDVDPAMDTVIREAAGAIERRLLADNSARERGLLSAYLDARRRLRAGAADGDGHLLPVDELVRSGLDRRDRTVLTEKAAELIASAQRAGVEVTLSDGRRVVLLSHVVTSASGVAGVAVEAVLTDTSPGQRPAPAHPRARLGHAAHAGPAAGEGPPAREAVAPAVLPAGRPAHVAAPAPAHPAAGVPARPTTARTAEPATAPGGADGLTGGRLVLLGEPGVGMHAVAARRRLELLSEASARIGTTLDVPRTAHELADMAVPRLADFVTIDLSEAVLRGEESADPRTDLHRLVIHGIRDDGPFQALGERIGLRPGTPRLRCLTDEQAVLEPDLRAAADRFSQDPEHTGGLLAYGLRSLITAPLLARGVVLGIVSFYRTRERAPFGDDDRSLAQELATRAAVCIDNARRYTREHTMVLALQRSLLPQRLPEQDAVEVAHRYLPAESGVGGDWFDVIPLSGTRVALVVGDVVGHGLHAAVTMGRLRIAARNFAELDLAPDEVLTQLDNLVARLDRDEGGEEPGTEGIGIIGATCLYAIYDPTSQLCTLARAGHPPPALVHPDGTVTFPGLPAGPPLGLGGLPFETAEIHVPEGSRLVLYTDGLIEDRHRDIDTALDQLRDALARSGPSPEDTCRAVVDAVVPDHPADDIALLVARTQTLAHGRIATWDLPADPARVSGVRADVTRRLTEWGLDEAVFSAELLLSELVTNAIRHAGGPLRVRVIHGRTLIFEVSDTSSTAPRLRHAAATDEGGRGLFLVARLAQAWGTRYTDGGKVIWAECALDVPTTMPSVTGIDWDDIPDIG